MRQAIEQSVRQELIYCILHLGEGWSSLLGALMVAVGFALVILKWQQARIDRATRLPPVRIEPSLVLVRRRSRPG